MARIKACGYTRMSTSKREQEHSPARQRESIEEYAEKTGYRLVDWYADDGISGDDTRKRSGFQRMIEDATAGDKFDAIIVWSRDRFGRFDSVESGYWSYRLRQADVQLVTVDNGPIDWDSFSGRITDSVTSEGKHQFLQDLSKTISSRMGSKAKTGKWAFGLTPFGYQSSDDGTLIPDPETSHVVQQLFEKYASGTTLRELSNWLDGQNIKTRRGKTWSPATLSELLKNEHYLGRLTYNRTSQSKYLHNVRTGRVINQPESNWIVVQDSHEPLVSQELFDAVQSRKKSNRLATGPKAMNGEFALKGLLRCGQCGGPMDGWFDRKANARKYICRTYQVKSDDCQRFVANEREVLHAVLKAIRTEVFEKTLTKEARAKLRDKMRELLVVQEQGTAIVEAQSRKVETQLAKAKRRLVEVESDMIPHVTERIRELENEQARLSDVLAAKRQESPANQIELANQRIEAAMGHLDRLETVTEKEYDPRAARELITQMVQSVRLNMVREPMGKRKHKSRLIGGEIHFRIAGMPQEVTRLLFEGSSTSQNQS